MPDKASILDMIDRSEAVYLATVSGTEPHLRALVNLRLRAFGPAGEFCRAAGMTMYYSTSLASAKVREIRANPAVAVYYSEPAQTHGITLGGRMEILADPALRRSLWCEGWRIYWPGGEDDPDYAILRLKPTFAAGWWGSSPFHLDLGAL